MLPTGELKSIKLEYEHLDKLFFSCFSLLHEEPACKVDLPTLTTTRSPELASHSLSLQDEQDRRRENLGRKY